MYKNVGIIIGVFILLLTPFVLVNGFNLLLTFILQCGLVLFLLLLLVFFSNAYLDMYNKRLIIKDLKIFKKYKNDSEKENLNLFSWAGEDTSVDYIMFYLLDNELDRLDPVANLAIIKERIKLRMGNNKEDYILLLKYIEFIEKNNFMSFLKKVSLVIGTYILGRLAFGDNMLEFLKFDMKSSHNNNSEVNGISNSSNVSDSNQILISVVTDAISSFFLYGMLGLFFIFITSLIYTSFSKKKRRIHLLRLIIETVLEDDKYF